MKFERQSWRDCSNAGSERANTRTVITSNHVIARATNPVQPVANSVHDCLQASQVALSIFPCNQGLDTGQTFDKSRTEVHPIAAVDKHSRSGGIADSAIIFKHPIVIGLRIIRWEH